MSKVSRVVKHMGVDWERAFKAHAEVCNGEKKQIEKLTVEIKALKKDICSKVRLISDLSHEVEKLLSQCSSLKVELEASKYVERENFGSHKILARQIDAYRDALHIVTGNSLPSRSNILAPTVRTGVEL